jgi:hypothetical protein
MCVAYEWTVYFRCRHTYDGFNDVPCARQLASGGQCTECPDFAMGQEDVTRLSTKCLPCVLRDQENHPPTK